MGSDEEEGGARKTEGKSPDNSSAPVNLRIRQAVLVALVLQHSGLALFMKIAARRSQENEERSGFAPTTAVVAAEVMKLATNVMVQTKIDGGFAGLEKTLRRDVLSQPWDCLKMGVPGALYTLQNNLEYVAIRNLAGPTYLVLRQLKILAAALCSVVMLKRHLSRSQWVCLLVLAWGAGLVQVSGSSDAAGAQSTNLTGLCAVLMACMTSGLAGVWFEQQLKGCRTSLWVRNMQLAGYGVLIGLGGVWFGGDAPRVLQNGFFHGYDRYVWCAVVMNYLLGTLVSLVVKYMDNIIKGFATSISVVLTAWASTVLFGFEASPLFLLGVAMVLGPSCLFSQLAHKEPSMKDKPKEVEQLILPQVRQS
ncbi:unnamed protein product [Chrysoparadoxa australica]